MKVVVGDIILAKKPIKDALLCKLEPKHLYTREEINREYKKDNPRMSYVNGVYLGLKFKYKE